MAIEETTGPQAHTATMKRRFQEDIEHLRKDIERAEEPQLKAMFETSAEVLEGLIKAYDHYDRQNEPAWRA